MNNFQFISMMTVVVVGLSIWWLLLLAAVREEISKVSVRCRLLEQSARITQHQKEPIGQPVRLPGKEPTGQPIWDAYRQRMTELYQADPEAFQAHVRRFEATFDAEVPTGEPVPEDVAVGLAGLVGAVKVEGPTCTYRYTKDHQADVHRRRAERREAAKIEEGLPADAKGVAVGTGPPGSAAAIAQAYIDKHGHEAC